MAEDDLWDCLKLSLEQQQCTSKCSDILSYKQGIPSVHIDPLTFGSNQPKVLFAEQPITGIIPCSSKYQSQKLTKFEEIRESIIDEIDEFAHSDYSGNFRTAFMQAYLPQEEYNFNQLLEAEFQPPGIETVLYTNHDMFSGKIESVSSAYLHSDLKQYSTTNVISKGQLIKDKHGSKNVKLGERLIDLNELEMEMHVKSNNFLKQSEDYRKQRELKHMQRIQDYNDRIENIEDKFIKDQINAIVHQLPVQLDMEFNELWGKLIEPKQEEQQQQQLISQKKQKKSEEIEFQENSIISESDLIMLSTLNELQQQAKQTAFNNNIQNDEQDEEQEQQEVQDDEPVFIDQEYFAEHVDVAIQEQDPVIRQQIELALAIKTKFRIVKATDIEKSMNVQNKDYRFSIEDESDMSDFYDQLPKAKMAKQFPFELDDFQKRSILHLEKKESVFVCAHTSAGKTVIAEYAIALAFKHNRRALYTSPIKALSNQKFREFDTKFGNTGVVTGDVSINPGSPCLILTTEILRNMLYRGAELIRDVEWVIFDEVHYVNDQERGMVWEETIIMLPPHIGIIMLSATVPNFMDFANWVGRTRKQKVFVMKTFTRPVPLEHHLFIFDKFHTIKEKDSDFLYEEYSQLKKKIKLVEDEKRGLRDRIKKNLEEKKEDDLYKNTNQSMRKKLTQKQIKSKFIQNVTSGSMKMKDEKRGISQLIRLCDKKELLPCVIFIFSRRKINELADSLMKLRSLKLIDNRTEGKIINFYDHALQKLKPQDRKSPQLLKLRELLRFGIAMHHGHLLPIAKEIVEILFSEGLIKVLLATETFAMGINMPTKTVIFHSIEKFDGLNGMRMLHSSEYTQMSGRAGRRGIDEKGNVIIYVRDANQLPEEIKIKKMVDQKGLNLESKFKMTYSIILNLLTSKDIDASEMMKRSYHENYRFIQLPKLMQSLERLKKEYVSQSLIQCIYQKGIRSGVSKSLIEEYTEINKTFRINQIQFVLKVMERSKININFPRYTIFQDHQGDISLGIIVGYENLNKQLYNPSLLQVDDLNYVKFNVLTIHSINEIAEEQYRFKKISLAYQTQVNRLAKQLRSKGEFYYLINEITEDSIIDFLEDQPKISNKFQINSQDNIYEECAQQLLEKQQEFPKMTDLLKYLFQQPQQQQQGNKKRNQVLSRLKYKLQKQKNIQVDNEDDDMNEFKFRDQTIQELIQHQCQFCDLKDMHMKQLSKKDQLRMEMQQIKKQIAGNDVVNQNDFENKLNVLKILGYVDMAGLPLIKARIARELMDQNSIYICEILVDNIMETLKPAEIASLMTAFVCQDRRKNDEDINRENFEIVMYKKFDEISLELNGAMFATFLLIERIIDEEIKLDALDFKDSSEVIKSVLNFNLTQVIYLWAKGQSFVDICLQTDIEEGSIVRTIQRLENMLRGVANAFKVMGNLKMAEKVEVACQMIKKDIVFAESLYFDPNAKLSDKQNKTNL